MRSLTVDIILIFILSGCEIWKIEDKPGSWEYVTEFPGSGRERAISFVIDDFAYIGFGYTRIGDINYDHSDSVLQNDFWKYDPSTNTWTKLSDFSGKTTRDVLGFSINGHGYVLIEDDFKNKMWEYDPSGDVWEQLSDFPGYSRRWAICFTLNNKAYFGLGNAYDTTLHDRIGATDLWEYNPIPRKWIRKADFPGMTIEYASSFTINNKAYICNGRLDTSSMLTTTHDIWEYNTENDTWTQRANFDGYSRHRAIAFTMSENGYMGVGRVVRTPGMSYPIAKDFWEYDCKNDMWRRIENFPSNLIDGLSFVIDNKCYVGIGDMDRHYYTNKIYQLKIN